MKSVVIFLFIYLALIAASIAGSILSGSTIDEQAADRKSYCELVSMWEQDAEQGIESAKRNGHPNYKGLECE